MDATPRTRAKRRARLTAAAVAGLALSVTAGACGLGDDGATPDDDQAAGGVSTSVTPSSDTGSNLDRERSDAASDMERTVSETLSELDAQVRDGNTVITLPERVLFEFDQDVLVPDAASMLDGIAQAITYFEDAPVRVNGRTDSRGDTAYNQALSERRAQAVVDHLVGAGVEPGRVTAQGLGETEPVAPNAHAGGSDNPEGRAQNRRVEVVIEGVDPAELS